MQADEGKKASLVKPRNKSLLRSRETILPLLAVGRPCVNSYQAFPMADPVQVQAEHPQYSAAQTPANSETKTLHVDGKEGMHIRSKENWSSGNLSVRFFLAWMTAWYALAVWQACSNKIFEVPSV